MPTSPYGSPAYMLGTGMSMLPQAMAQSEDMRQTAAMKKLQLQELQRQADTNADIDTAQSMPMTPQSYTTSMQNPEYQKQQEDYASTQEDQGKPVFEGGSLSEGGEDTQPMASKAVQKPTAMPTVQTEHQFDYKSMPYLRRAHESQQVAERLRAMGRGRAASAIEDEGLKYQEAHKQQGLSQMASAILGGQLDDATKWANSLGMNIQNIKLADDTQDPSDPDALSELDSIQPDGSIKKGFASKQDLVSMSDPKMAMQSMISMQRQQSMYNRYYDVQKLKNQGQIDKQKVIIQGKLDQIKQAGITGGSAGVKGALIKIVEDDLVANGMDKKLAHTKAINQIAGPKGPAQEKISTQITALAKADANLPQGTKFKAQHDAYQRMIDGLAKKMVDPNHQEEPSSAASLIPGQQGGASQQDPGSLPTFKGKDDPAYIEWKSKNKSGARFIGPDGIVRRLN